MLPAFLAQAHVIWYVLLVVAVLLIVHCWRRRDLAGPLRRPRGNRVFWSLALITANPLLILGYAIMSRPWMRQWSRAWFVLPVLVLVLHVAMVAVNALTGGDAPEGAITYRQGEPAGASGWSWSCRHYSDSIQSHASGSFTNRPLSLLPHAHIGVRCRSDRVIDRAIAHACAQRFLTIPGVVATYCETAGSGEGGERVDLLVDIVSDLTQHGGLIRPLHLTGTVATDITTSGHPDLITMTCNQRLEYSGTISGVQVGTAAYAPAVEAIADQIRDYLAGQLESALAKACHTGPIPEVLFPPVSDAGIPADLAAHLEATALRAVGGYLCEAAARIDSPVRRLVADGGADLDRVQGFSAIVDALMADGWRSNGRGWSAPSHWSGCLRRDREYLTYRIAPLQPGQHPMFSGRPTIIFDGAQPDRSDEDDAANLVGVSFQYHRLASDEDIAVRARRLLAETPHAVTALLPVLERFDAALIDDLLAVIARTDMAMEPAIYGNMLDALCDTDGDRALLRRLLARVRPMALFSMGDRIDDDKLADIADRLQAPVPDCTSPPTSAELARWQVGTLELSTAPRPWRIATVDPEPVLRLDRAYHPGQALRFALADGSTYGRFTMSAADGPEAGRWIRLLVSQPSGSRAETGQDYAPRDNGYHIGSRHNDWQCIIHPHTPGQPYRVSILSHDRDALAAVE